MKKNYICNIKDGKKITNSKKKKGNTFVHRKKMEY